MTNGYPSPEAVKAVLDYFKMNIHFVCDYLESIDPSFATYIKAQESEVDNHLNNAEAACASSFYEIMDTLYTIVGGYPRLNFFFKENNEFLKENLSDKK